MCLVVLSDTKGYVCLTDKLYVGVVYQEKHVGVLVCQKNK